MGRASACGFLILPASIGQTFWVAVPIGLVAFRTQNPQADACATAIQIKFLPKMGAISGAWKKKVAGTGRFLVALAGIEPAFWP